MYHKQQDCSHYSLRSYFHPGEPTDYAILAALLRMGTKYMAVRMRRDVINHLKMAYPASRLDYNKRTDLFVPQEGHAIRALHMASEGIPIGIILPAIYCHLAELPVADVILGIEVSDRERLVLPESAQRICLVGRDRLLRESITDGLGHMVLLSPMGICGCPEKPAPNCTTTLIKALQVEIDVAVKCDIFSRPMPYQKYCPNDDMCMMCMGCWEADEHQAYDDMWTDVPGYFGLERWETLVAEDNSDV